MQLKRDTDYALRLLLCAVKYADQKNSITLFELCSRTAVPITIASRLCHKLSEAQLISEYIIGGRAHYTVYDDALSKTLFDVIQAVEGNGSLFSVFDRSTEMFSCCRQYFQAAEQCLTDSLKGLTLQDLKNATSIP